MQGLLSISASAKLPEITNAWLMCIMWRRGFYQLAPLLDYLTDILLDVVTDDSSSISIERFGQLNATYVQSNSDLSYDIYATLRYSGQYLPVSHLLQCVEHISHCWKKRRGKKRFTLFSNHNGSLLRRQPENIVEAFCVAWCLLPFPWTYVVCCCVKTHRSQHSGKFVITILHLPSKPHFSQLSTQYL